MYTVMMYSPTDRTFSLLILQYTNNWAKAYVLQIIKKIEIY